MASWTLPDVHVRPSSNIHKAVTEAWRARDTESTLAHAGGFLRKYRTSPNVVPSCRLHSIALSYVCLTFPVSSSEQTTAGRWCLLGLLQSDVFSWSLFHCCTPMGRICPTSYEDVNQQKLKHRIIYETLVAHLDEALQHQAQEMHRDAASSHVVGETRQAS